jgi:autotransporter-associated beta strand protein
VGAGTYTLNVGGAGNTTINGAITGAAGSALTKDGAGTLAIGASNASFSGTVAVNAGTLQTNVNNAFKNTTAVTVASGATLSLNGTTQSLGTLADSGALSFGTNSSLTLGSGASSLNGTLTGSGTLVLGTGSTLTLGANFSDPSLNITLAGGTLMLNGTTDAFGLLDVTSSSIVDFGSPATSQLDVSDVTLSAGVQLSVNHWTNTTDFFYSTTSPGNQGMTPIDQIVFSGYAGSQTHWNTYASGPENLNQITPTPEPATYGAIFICISLAGIIIHRRRRGAG